MNYNCIQRNQSIIALQNKFKEENYYCDMNYTQVNQMKNPIAIWIIYKWRKLIKIYYIFILLEKNTLQTYWEIPCPGHKTVKTVALAA